MIPGLHSPVGWPITFISLGGAQGVMVGGRTESYRDGLPGRPSAWLGSRRLRRTAIVSAALVLVGLVALTALPTSTAATLTGGCTQPGASPSVVTCIAAGTYKPDATTCSVLAAAWGGGGGGGGSGDTGATGFGGGGGAGGTYASGVVPVSSATTYTVTVGTGGAGGGASANGGTGGQSWFKDTLTVRASGGLGGRWDDGNAETAPGSTAGSAGTTQRKGGDGAGNAGGTTYSGGGGGGGGSTTDGSSASTWSGGTGGTSGGGAGANGRTTQGNGFGGNAPGGGGSGGYNPGFTLQSGGPGARGQVVLTESPCNVAPTPTALGPVTLNEDCSGTASSTCGALTSAPYGLTASDADEDDPQTDISFCVVSTTTAAGGTMFTTAPALAPVCPTTASTMSDDVARLDVTYRPVANFCNGAPYSTPDTFQYQAYDGKAFSAVQTVNLQVTCVNDAPTAPGGSTSVAEDAGDTSITVPGADVDNPPNTPAPGDQMQFCAATLPSNGVTSLVAFVCPTYTTLGAAGTTSYAATYTPNAQFCGSDSFTYQTRDAAGTESATPGTFTITLTCTADAPVEMDDDYSVFAASTVFPGTAPSYPTVDPPSTADCAATYGAAYGVLCNDYDYDMKWYSGSPDALTAVTFSGVTCEDFDGAGSLTSSSSTGAFTFAYSPLNFDTCHFTYRPQDSTLTLGVQTAVTIHVIAADPRTVDDSSWSTPEETTFTASACGATTEDWDGGPYYGVLCNDVNGPNDPVEVTLLSGPTNGVLATPLALNGFFEYTPNNDFEGTDSFQYKMHDIQVGSTNADTNGVVTITVTHVNDAPTATDGVTAATNEETPVLASVTGADPDTPYGEVLRYCRESGPTYGTLSMPSCTDTPATSPSFTYTPDLNYCNQPFSLATDDSFVFRVLESDVAGGAATATQYLQVTCVNDAPTAGNDTYTGVLGYPLDTWARGFSPIVALDIDPDSPYSNQGLAPFSPLCSQPTMPGASVSVSASGHFNYTPAGSTQYTDTFSYQVVDNGSPGLVSSNCAWVTLTIQPDLPPVSRFTASPTTVRVGEVVTFVDSSYDPDIGGYVNGWNWAFGDGYAATSSAPSHIYGIVGSYSACLSAVDEWGVGGALACRTITVIAASGSSSSGQGTTSSQPSGDTQDNPDDPPPQELKVAPMAAQTVAPGQAVTISATVTGAASPTFEWRQTNGAQVTLVGATSWSATFTAGAADNLYFEFTVRDGGEEVSAGVLVVVEGEAGVAPVARVGPDARAMAGDVVVLDGSASSGGSGVSYLWMQLEGPAVSINDPMSAKASFIMPDTTSRLRFALEVSDGQSSSTALQIVRLATSGGAVTGDQSEGFTVSKGADGSITVTPLDPAAQYTWDFGDGSAPVTTEGPTTHTYTAIDQYTITLTMTDEAGVEQQTQQVARVDAVASRPAAAVAGAGTGVPLWLVLSGAGLVLAAGAAGAFLLLRKRVPAPASA